MTCNELLEHVYSIFKPQNARAQVILGITCQNEPLMVRFGTTMVSFRCLKNFRLRRNGIFCRK